MAAESNIVGEVGLLVKPIDPGADARVKKIIERMEKLAVFPVTADTSQASAATKQLSQQIDDQIGGSWQQAGMQVAAFTAAVYGTKRAVEMVINRFAGLFDQLAKAKAGFTAILGSETKGNKLLADIREFARVSPFVTQELVNYSQQLLGVGQSAESIVPLLKRTGDLISSVGGDTQNIGRVLFTLTQIRSIGRLAGQDAMQLQSSLIPITKMLAENLGKTTAQVKAMQEKGAISADMVFEAISKAGEKVEGAMNRATRNISGAKAVLSDTFTIMLQNSPALQKMFDDIWHGILKMAEALGKPEIQDMFNQLFEKVGMVYEALKPLLSAMTEFSSTIGITAFKTLTPVLGAFANVLNAIPESVLKALGTFLAAISVMKAPLMLIKSFERLGVAAKGLFGQAGAVGAGSTNALLAQSTAYAKLGNQLDNQTQSVSRLSAAWSSYGSQIKSTLAIAALIGGSALANSDPTNETAGAVGGALQGAGMGYMVGGVWGAAAGAVIGGVTGLFNAADAKAKAYTAKLKGQGAEAAEVFLSELDRKFGAGTSQTKIESFVAHNETLRAKLNTATGNVGTSQSQLTSLSDYYGMASSDQSDAVIRAASPEYFAKYGREVKAIEKDIRAAEAATKQWTAEQLRLQGELERTDVGEYHDYLVNVQGGIRQLLKDGNTALVDAMPSTSNPAVRATYDAFMGGAIDSTRELNTLTEELARHGLVLDDIVNDYPKFVRLMGKDVPAAYAAAMTAASNYTNAITEAKKAGADNVTAFQTEISMMKSYREAVAGVNQTFAALKANGASEAGIGDAADAILSNSINVYARTKQALLAQDVKDVEATEEALRAQTDYQAATFKALQTQLNLSDAAFKELLVSAGAWNAYSSVMAEMNGAVSGTFSEVAQKLGVTNDELMTLLGIQKAIDPNITIVVTADTAKAKAALDGILAAITAIKGGGMIPDGMSRSEYLKELEDARKRALAQLSSPGAYSTIDTRVTATSGGRGGGGGSAATTSVADKVASAVSALSNAVSGVVDAAKAWTATIKERTQYEQSISASRAITNTNRQITDITAMTAGLANLRARGVSDAVLAALDINALTDVRQVQRLVASSDSDLAALSAAVSQRDAMAQTLASSQADARTKKNITDAILAAAKALGYKVSETQAQSLQTQFVFQGNNLTADDIAYQILSVLSGGSIHR